MINFNQIPSRLLTPGSFQEVDASLASEGENIKKVLLIGQKTSAGSAALDRPVRVRTKREADGLLGDGSDLAVMASDFLSRNREEHLYALPVTDNPGGVKAVHKITLTGSPPESGSLPLYVDGRKIQTPVRKGDSLDTVVTNVIGAVNSSLNCRVEASKGSSSGEIELTSHHPGETGNDIDIRFYLFGDSFPAGLSGSYSLKTKGTGNPDITPGLKALGDTHYHYFVSSISDKVNIKKLSDELESRYSALRQIGGRAFVGLSGSVIEMIKKGEAFNSPHISLLPAGENPEGSLLWAVRAAAVLGRELSDDPSVNLVGTSLKLIVTKPLSLEDRQKLLEAGISTYTVGSDGLAYSDRQVTTYNTDVDGNRDVAYLDIQIPETIDAIRRTINRQARNKYKGYKLSRTEENFGGGAKVMTPALWKAFLVSIYRDTFIQGKQWCQDFDTYKKSIKVEINTQNNKARLDYEHRPQLIGRLLILAGNLKFE